MPKSRSGKRPMRVSTLLGKHDDRLKKHGQAAKGDAPDADFPATVKSVDRQSVQGTQLSDGFLPSYVDGTLKTAHLTGFIDELSKIALTQPSAQEITHSADRYDRLKNTAPSAGEAVRGASVGAALGPAATMLQRSIAGAGAAGGLKAYRGKRDLAALAAQGAVAGGLVPALRHTVERSAEKSRLKGYLKNYQAEPE